MADPQQQGEKGQDKAQGEQATRETGAGRNEGPGAGRSAEQMQEEMQRLREDLAKLQGDLQQVAESAMGWGRESYAQARDAASERLEVGMDQLEQYVQQRPLTTVIIAFGIGLIAGTLFRR